MTFLYIYEKIIHPQHTHIRVFILYSSVSTFLNEIATDENFC